MQHLTTGSHPQVGHRELPLREVAGDLASTSRDSKDPERNASESENTLGFGIDNVPITRFVAASSRRNANFHALFPEVPECEFLIEDYECELLTNCLAKGRLYISGNHVCFSGNGAKYATNHIIPLHEITNVEKTISDLPQYAIQIFTRAATTTFTSFPSCHTAYVVIYNTWRLSLPRPDSVHKPTRCACETQGKHFETCVMDIIIPGTPQAIFNLIFASRFLEDFLRWEQGFMEIQISGWHPRGPGSLLLARSMTYINPFSDPVCSEQIIYELKDYTLHFDFDDYVSILTVMRIPGIPSDNVFLTKVKTCIMWASATASRLIVTIAVEWTGMSFIESIIDKSTINRQIQYYTELEDAMRSYISAHRTEFVPDNVVEDPEAQSWLESVPIRGSDLQNSIPVGPKHTSLLQPINTNLLGTLRPPLLLGTRDGATSASQLLAANITDQLPNRVCGIHTPVTGYSSKDNSRFISKKGLGSVPIELTVYELSTSHPADVTDVLQPYSPRYVASVMYDCLIQHGCPDLTASIDPLGFSSSAVAEGGFGDIWTGRLYNTSGKLAIKLLRFAPLTEDATKKDLKRITREIYNWSKLDHENVNKLMGVTMFRERLAMVSEWMEYGNLRQYLSRNMKVNRRELCVQIARGVVYLHEVNMVHGDLKACNILVSSTGVLKITDFDYSISSECSLGFSVTTRMGGGTYRWMAPELLLDEDPPQRNTKTDVYALGMTFLETITNANPYSECQHESQIYGKLSRKEHPKRPEEYLSATEWGTRMWSLLLQCWDFNPVLRPTANTVLKLLLVFENKT